MDLETIQTKLYPGSYHYFKYFQSDVHLTFDNATLYTKLDLTVKKYAKELKQESNDDFKKLDKRNEIVVEVRNLNDNME